jgi:hypothetical protein
MAGPATMAENSLRKVRLFMVALVRDDIKSVWVMVRFFAGQAVRGRNDSGRRIGHLMPQEVVRLLVRVVREGN